MTHRLIVLLALAVVLIPATSGLQVADTSPRPATGQSATLLPDGRWLLLGGEIRGGVTDGAAIWDPRTQTTAPVAGRLGTARAWHTATVLPDGRVLIVGGVAGAGPTASVERFDPTAQTFEGVEHPALVARARHTATLLTDGRVFIAGGVGAAGTPLAAVEAWDWRTSAAHPAGALSEPRSGHEAVLLGDGTVLIWGGQGAAGIPLQAGEVYDPAYQTSNAVTTRPATGDNSSDPARLEASLPADGAADVPAEVIIALRFSRPMRPDTANGTTMVLVGGGRVEPASVVAAEGGRLAFVTPQAPLLGGTAYTLSINGPVDTAGFLLPAASLTFVTAPDAGSGQAPAAPPPAEPAVDTDETGHGHAHVTNADGHPAVDQTAPVELDEKEWTGERREGKPHSRWQELPPLQAPPGVTALAGQVLRLNGRPLADVTLRIGARAARTDDTGRFLLRDVPAGYPALIMDGSTASRRGKTYATFDVGVHVDAGMTTVLPYTIWLPLIDTAHATRVPVPTPGEIVATTPRVPGLEMRIPAGVVLRARDGQPLRWVTLTEIPVDRPPFPLPEGTTFFFTPQTHGAQVERADGTPSPRGVRFILPNDQGLAPGVRVDLWSYDTRGRHHVYGQGTVRRDGQQILPDPEVQFFRVGCLYYNNLGPGSLAPASGAKPGGPGGGDPVDLATGLFVYSKTDLVLPDVIPIVVTRTYRPLDATTRAFGVGGNLPYQVMLTGDQLTFAYADLVQADGSKIRYTRTSPGTDKVGAVMEHTATPTKFNTSVLTWNSTRPGWDISFKDGTVWEFQPTSPNWGPHLEAIRDRHGNRLTILRSTVNTQTWQALRVMTPNGRWVEFTYQPNTIRITQARDNAGRTVSYTYDASQRLTSVTDPAGGVTEYTYDTQNRMATIKDARGIVFTTNEYDAAGRVIRQTQADGTTYQFAYTLDVDGKIIQTDVTNPRGHVRRLTFNAAGYPLTDTAAHGTPIAQTTTYERNAANQPTAITDALDRRTEYTYDAQGNVLTATRLAGTPNAVTTTFTYEPTFNQVATVTNPLSHTTTFGYDVQGNLTTTTNPLGHQVTMTYNAAGQPLTVTTPAGTTTFGYDRGDLATVTDPTGKAMTRFTDSVGRLAALTNPLGQRTRYEYDVLNRLTKITDALGGLTRFGYDPNDNLLAVTDTRSNATTYAYNNMDRVQTRTDPLLRTETYAYDNNGNLATFTDRKSQVTSQTYDALDRLTQVTYADASTTSYTWDVGNRLTQIADSLSGTISRTHDLLNRLTQEQTPQGTVSYTYDAAGRRTGMTVAGQPTVTYAYDNANRLTTISQGTNVVSYSYDTAGRQTSLTLPNGVVTEYAYDAASRLTGLTYKNGPVTLGTLTYGYDSNGSRRQIGGSWARTGLPQLLASATYDAGNRPVAFGGATLTHDLNGNLTSDGSTTYAWDARDRLTGLSGPGVTGSFQYDAAGRRLGKTLSGTTTTVLHNGLDAAQETTGTTIRNILTGAGIDEYLSHASTSGEVRFALADALGSTVALVDPSGSVVTEYTYEPFGATTTTGAPSENRSAYTGRENDGTGLYYYRARYYQPRFQRFISEDPLRMRLRGQPRGGLEQVLLRNPEFQHWYVYATNNPMTWSDPYGLINWGKVTGGVILIGGGAAKAGLGAWMWTLASAELAKAATGKGDFMHAFDLYRLGALQVTAGAGLIGGGVHFVVDGLSDAGAPPESGPPPGPGSGPPPPPTDSPPPGCPRKCDWT